MKIDFFTNKGRYIFKGEGIFISSRVVTIFLTEEKRLDFEKVGENFIRKGKADREILTQVLVDGETIKF